MTSHKASLPVRAWAVNNNYYCAIHKPVIEWGEDSTHWKTYGIPLTNEGYSLACLGGSSIVEAVRLARPTFGDFNHYMVNYDNDTLLNVYGFQNNDWMWYVHGVGLDEDLANGEFVEDDCVNALERATIAAAAVFTQTEEKNEG